MTDTPLPHVAFPGVSWNALAAECGREHGARRRVYAGRVAKGNMTQAEADHELKLAVAWCEDVERIRACWIERPGSPSTRPDHGLPWRDRRAGLLRELELRARLYPTWIASGRVIEADARRQVDALACLLAIYEDGWDWCGSDGKLPGDSPLAAEEFTALRSEIDAREGRSQKELAL